MPLPTFTPSTPATDHALFGDQTAVPVVLDAGIYSVHVTGAELLPARSGTVSVLPHLVNEDGELIHLRPLCVYQPNSENDFLRINRAMVSELFGVTSEEPLTLAQVVERMDHDRIVTVDLSLTAEDPKRNSLARVLRP